MKSRFKKIWITSSISSLAFITPFVVTSCSDLPKGDISKQEQTTALESEAAKITILDSWLTTTYTALYTTNIKPNSSDLDKEKITNSFRYYLDYLKWPESETGKLVGSETTVSFAIDENLLSNEEKNKFVKNIEEAYKFYVSFMSIVQSSSNEGSDSNSSIQPKVYFQIKATEWKKNKYNVWAPIESDTGKSLTITDFNPSLSYTGCSEDGNLIKDDFKILMSTRGTLVYQNVMKLLLSEMYFLHATEDQIKNGTNFNKMTKNPSSVNYINTMSFVDHSTSEISKFNTFLLKKYMVEKSPTFKWSYSSDDYTTSVSTSGLISTINQFNNLSTTLDTKLSNTIVPNSNEIGAINNLSNLEAYNKFEINSESSSETELTEDLANDIDSIKLFGSSKIGLLDTKTNKLFTFSEFEAIKGAIDHNSKNSNKLSLPSINVKEESKNKNSYSLLIGDLKVAWNDVTVEPTNNNEFKNESNGIIQTLIINSIGYKPSETNTQKVTISFTYKYKINAEAEKSFDYSFVLENWSQKEQDQNNILSKGYLFSGDPNKVGIEIFDTSDGSIKPKGVTYYLRALPIFEKFADNGQIYIGKNWYMRGQFTFKNTPWNTEEEQRKLIYFFLLSDSSLFNSIKDFYLFNNFNVEGDVSELTSQISSLGLSKKTNDDRKNAGII